MRYRLVMGILGCLALATILLAVPGAIVSEETVEEQPVQKTYSNSGYDLTPLTEKELTTILEGLTPEQIEITQRAGTEPPFCGNLTYTEEAGIYVSVVGGLPLFRSTAKFKSQSGWASFFQPFDPAHIIEREDRSLGVLRTEIIDARSGAHLGHLFRDGPEPSGLRYCLNSAALRFIPEGEAIPVESSPTCDVAYFAGGCFWGIEDTFARVPGVVDAVSGYQNGSTEEPTYRQVCSGRTGHAESVRVIYDPEAVSYESLLEEFFRMHDPTTINRQGPDVGTQYRSSIFFTDESQRARAEEYVAALARKKAFGTQSIVTRIEQAGLFYEAEAYHQDYYDRHGGSCPTP